MLNPKLKLVRFEDMHRKSMKNPEFKKAWDALDPEFRLIRIIMKRRLENKLTQRELAKKMGTDQATLSRYETGRYNPSIKFLKRMAKALDAKLNVTLS